MIKKYSVTVNGTRYEVEVEELGEEAPAKTAQPSFVAAPEQPVRASAEGSKSVKAPMPGTVLRVFVKAGDKIKPGDPLVVLEAMKMENEITAPEEGVVASVPATAGSSVAAGAELVTYN